MAKPIDLRKQELNDLKSVLDTDFGKRVFLRMIERAKLLQPTYGSGCNTHDFAFNEGARNYGLWVLGEVRQADPNAWLEMQRMQLDAQAQFIEDKKNVRSSD